MVYVNDQINNNTVDNRVYAIEQVMLLASQLNDAVKVLAKRLPIGQRRFVLAVKSQLDRRCALGRNAQHMVGGSLRA